MQDLAERSIDRLAEDAGRNFRIHASWIAERTPGMRVIADERLVLVDSGLSCDSFNVICQARLDAGAARDRVREAVNHFQDASRPFSWWVGPADRPARIGEVLQANGLEAVESDEDATSSCTSRSVAIASLGGLPAQAVRRHARQRRGRGDGRADLHR